MKALVGALNQEKALVGGRGLLRDFEIFPNLHLKLYRFLRYHETLRVFWT